MFAHKVFSMGQGHHCVYFFNLSLAKDGNSKGWKLVMAGFLFWKFNGLDAKGMSWSYTSGKVVL